MLPGAYTSPLQLVGLTSTLEVVATGAEITVGPAIVVDRGGKLSVRGLSTLSGEIRCGSPSATPSELTLRDAKLRNITGTGEITVEQCTLNLTDVDMVDVNSWSLRGGTIFRADRIFRHAAFTDTNGIIVSNNTQLYVQNSVIEEMVLAVFGSGLDVVFSNVTLAYNTDERFCQTANPNVPSFRVLFENSILHTSDPMLDVLRNLPPSSACTFTNTLLNRQTSPPTGSFVGDPTFVSVSQHDYHLQGGSPAIDVGIPGTLTTDHDFDGTARPQGPKPDLGAFELKP